MKVIAGKGVLAMMPEARLSTVGKFEDIQCSTFRFIKKVGVPVYTININGSYLASPKWGDKTRKGAVVEAEIVEHFRGPKLIAFKMKRRKGYRRRKGHRQERTRVKILSVG